MVRRLEIILNIKMKLARKVELLVPAKNLECGIEAIRHGALCVS